MTKKWPGHEAVYLDNKPIDFRNPPPANQLVKWTKKTQGGKEVRGSFRHICHLNRLNLLARRRFGVELVVIQAAYNTTVSASAGTHDLDATVDLYIPGVSWWTQQTFFRANGLGCWYRHAPLFSNHIHGFTLPPREGQSISDDFQVHGFKVGIYVDGGYSTRGRLVTSSQIDDYYRHAFGLAGQHATNSDTSWYPASIASTIFDLRKYVKNRSKR